MSFEESTEATPYAVICPSHGRVYLTEREYDRQMVRAASRWECPRYMADDPDAFGPCGAPSEFDDVNYECAGDE